MAQRWASKPRVKPGRPHQFTPLGNIREPKDIMADSHLGDWLKITDTRIAGRAAKDHENNRSI